MAGASSDDADATGRPADEQTGDAGSSAHPVRAEAREAGEPGRGAGASGRRVSASAREARAPTRDAGRSARDADDRTPLPDDRTPLANDRTPLPDDRTPLPDAQSSDARVPGSEARDRTRLPSAQASDARVPGSEARDRTRLPSAQASEPRVPGSEARDRTRLPSARRANLGHPGSEARDRTRLPSAQASEPRAPAGEPGAPDRVPDAPTSLAAYRARVTRPAVSLEEFRAFLARAETRGWVAAIVRERVPAEDADDLAQDALAEALQAFVRAPPAKDEVLVSWIATIARRVVADSLKKRGRRRKYEGPMPNDPDSGESESSSADGESESEGAAEPSYDPREGSVDDRELESRSLLQWLERQVADRPVDRETLAILLEHGLGQKTYQTIADERGITLTVLSSRIFEFRNKYVARYKRERERAWLLLLLFLFGAAVVAVLVWLLWARDEPPRGTVRPSAPSNHRSSARPRAPGRPVATRRCARTGRRGRGALNEAPLGFSREPRGAASSRRAPGSAGRCRLR